MGLAWKLSKHGMGLQASCAHPALFAPCSVGRRFRSTFTRAMRARCSARMCWQWFHAAVVASDTPGCRSSSSSLRGIQPSKKNTRAGAAPTRGAVLTTPAPPTNTGSPPASSLQLPRHPALQEHAGTARQKGGGGGGQEAHGQRDGRDRGEELAAADEGGGLADCIRYDCGAKCSLIA